jgi:hypothetical protein
VLKINEVVSEVLSEVVLNIVTLLKTRPIIDPFNLEIWPAINNLHLEIRPIVNNLPLSNLVRPIVHFLDVKISPTFNNLNLEVRPVVHELDFTITFFSAVFAHVVSTWKCQNLLIGSKAPMNLLENERLNSPFPVRELTYFLNDGDKKTRRKEEVESWIENDNIFSLKTKYYQNRKEELIATHEKCRRFHEITSKNKVTLFSDDWWTLFMTVNDNTPLILHFQMFVTVLMSQADPEQVSWWVNDAIDMKILGCYAQTEIGHGSNINIQQGR